MEENQQILIHAMFSTGVKADYTLKPNSTVSDLINMVTLDSSVEKPPNKVISIIYFGCILQPTDNLSSYQKDELTVNVFFRIPPQDLQNQNPDEDLKGFDRLTRMNYSQEQISNIRERFHQNQGTSNLSREEQLDIEEEWFPTIFNQENPLEAFDLIDHQSPSTVPFPDVIPLTPNQIEENSCSAWKVLEFCFGLLIGLVFGFSSFVLFFFVNIHDDFFLLIGSGFGIVCQYLVSLYCNH